MHINNMADAVKRNATIKTWDGLPALNLGIVDRFDRLFIRKDGKDVRTLPKVKHSVTGKFHFDW